MTQCSMRGCTNNSSGRPCTTNGPQSFHNFPQDRRTRRMWMRATGKAGKAIGKTASVCGDHFDEKDKTRKNGKVFLSSTAVPRSMTFKGLNGTSVTDLGTANRQQKAADAGMRSSTDNVGSPAESSLMDSEEDAGLAGQQNSVEDGWAILSKIPAKVTHLPASTSAADEIAESGAGELENPEKSDRKKWPRNELGQLECDICKREGIIRTYTRKNNLSDHKKKCHPELHVPRYGYACREDDCHGMFHFLSQFIEHLSNDHDLPDYTVAEQEFSCERDFKEWKCAQLEQTSTWLNHRYNQDKEKTMKSGLRIAHWTCFHHPKRTFAEYPEDDWSTKGFKQVAGCTAYMKVTERQSETNEIGMVPHHVEYCLTHYGHDPTEDAQLVKDRLALPANQTHLVDTAYDSLSQDSLEIFRLHADIVLALNEICASGAPGTLKALQTMHENVVTIREEAVEFKRKASEALHLGKMITKRNPKKKKLEHDGSAGKPITVDDTMQLAVSDAFEASGALQFHVGSEFTFLVPVDQQAFAKNTHEPPKFIFTIRSGESVPCDDCEVDGSSADALKSVKFKANTASSS